MILLGGGLAVLYVQSGIELRPFLAFNVGASAPLIIERLGAAAPDYAPGSIS